MKKIFFIFLLIFFAKNTYAIENCIQVIQPAINSETGECREFPTPCDVPIGWKKVNSCDNLDNNTDTQIIDYLNKDKREEIKELNFNFKLHKEKSCTNLETIFNEYINAYYKLNKDRWNYRTVPYVMEKYKMIDDTVLGKRGVESNMVGGDKGIEASDFSFTNIQVSGVDEGDIIKNDNKFIYYYNSKYNYIYILEAYPGIDAKVVKKIKLPQGMYDVNLYLDVNKLIVLGNIYNYKYSEVGYIGSQTKTYIIVYDITNKQKLILDKIHIIDGSLINSRKVGDYIYTITTNYINIPYYDFYSRKIKNIDFKINDILPKEVSISKSDKNQNLIIKGKKYPYNIFSKKVSNCEDIEYILPDEDTLEKYDFSPSVNVISAINIKDPTKKVINNVIIGNVSEIHMSKENLYLTSHIYAKSNFRCGWGYKCFVPFYHRGENTLVHKYNISKENISYFDSIIIPGTPLSQYSMDEFEGNFRIITKKFYPELNTNLYILDNNLKLVGKLEDIKPNEEFKSSRYIGDKLYLVTFKQVDPLFVIDLKDIKNPKVLGELKIPGYSTYLHYYDEKHLIGLGYDTTINKWGGVQNSGIKLDLYEINYDKKCLDDNLTKEETQKCESGDYKGIIVKQKFTQTFGSVGSYSEALNNPRVFVWNKNKKLLLFPATLYESDSEDFYDYKSMENVTLVINIDKDIGIKLLGKVTNIDLKKVEEEQNKDCKQYLLPKKEIKCVELKNGEKYCPQKNVYIPEYCYKEATALEYLAKRSWDFGDYFILRNIYMDNNLYTISNNLVKVSDMNKNFDEIKKVYLK